MGRRKRAAVAEGKIAETLERPREADGGELGTVLENIRTDRGDSIGNADRGKGSAVKERSLLDRSECCAVGGENDRDEGWESLKGPLSDGEVVGRTSMCVISSCSQENKRLFPSYCAVVRRSWLREAEEEGGGEGEAMQGDDTCMQQGSRARSEDIMAPNASEKSSCWSSAVAGESLIGR